MASRKRKLEDQADDYSGGIESEMNKFMKTSTKKHTLDSDDEEEDEDEYNRKKYDIMKEDDIEGQEEGTQDFDGETKLTPFNMKDELEEGYFDGSGMYIWNKKDASEIKDSWLDSIDWMKVKRSDGDQPNKPPSKVKEESSDSEGEIDTSNGVELFKQVLVYLRPGESILKAIKRLGAGKQLSASERLKQKKLAAKLQQGQSSSTSTPPTVTDSEKADKEKLVKLTELANKIMSTTGNMDVYDETYESLRRKIVKDLEPVTLPPPPPPKPADEGLDMFGD